MRQADGKHDGAFLAYVSHSGFGHQLQMLLRGLFLAKLAARTLLLPPLMTHGGSLDIDGAPRSCIVAPDDCVSLR